MVVQVSAAGSSSVNTAGRNAVVTSLIICFGFIVCWSFNEISFFLSTVGVFTLDFSGWFYHFTVVLGWFYHFTVVLGWFYHFTVVLAGFYHFTVVLAGFYHFTVVRAGSTTLPWCWAGFTTSPCGTCWFYHFTIVMVQVNSIINPFIYAAKYHEFQKGVRRLLRKQVHPAVQLGNQVAGTSTARQVGNVAQSRQQTHQL